MKLRVDGPQETIHILPKTLVVRERAVLAEASDTNTRRSDKYEMYKLSEVHIYDLPRAVAATIDWCPLRSESRDARIVPAETIRIRKEEKHDQTPP